VPWGAGGGTDAVARMIASLMEKDLGQPVNVVNRTGGSGVVGHSAIASAAPDGYTIGMITVEITMMHHQKLTELNPTSYTPIALVNLDPAGFQVRADSPYKNMADVLAAIKARPRASSRPRAPARAASGTWRWPAGCATPRSTRPPCPGCPATAPRRACRTWWPAASNSHLLAARGALADRRRQGQVAGGDGQAPRGAVPQRAHAEGATGSDWATGAWRGIAAPKGLPANGGGAAGGQRQEGLRQQGIQGLHGPARLRPAVGHWQGLRAFMAKGDADMKAVMTAVGLAK
jgi:tripartite-type tricarboxylate transporter receptor subunit TctC